MAVYVAAIHLSGGTGHEHIASFVWVQEGTFKSGISDQMNMAKFIADGGQVKVSDGLRQAAVGVVRPQGGAPYLRSFADGQWTDNLLSMPRF